MPAPAPIPTAPVLPTAADQGEIVDVPVRSMGLSPVKGLFALAGQLICDCCLDFADSSLFGAEKAVLRPVAYDQVPGARGRGQGTETLA